MATEKQHEMTCQQVRRELSNYLDGDVEKLVKKAVKRHLATCKTCDALYRSTRNVLLLCRDQRVVEVPPGYYERLHDFLARQMKE